MIGIHTGHPIRAAATGWTPLRVSLRLQTPVCIVPAGWTEGDDPVTVGVADDGSSNAALDFGVTEASTTGTGLRLVHSWLMPSPTFDYGTALTVDPEVVIDGHRRILDGAAQRVLRQRPTLSVTRELIRDSRSAALLRFDLEIVAACSSEPIAEGCWPERCSALSHRRCSGGRTARCASCRRCARRTSSRISRRLPPRRARNEGLDRSCRQRTAPGGREALLVGVRVLELEDGGLRPALQAELAQHRRDVVLHRLLGDAQMFADLPVRQTVGDQFERLPFPQPQ